MFPSPWRTYTKKVGGGNWEAEVYFEVSWSRRQSSWGRASCRPALLASDSYLFRAKKNNYQVFHRLRFFPSRLTRARLKMFVKQPFSKLRRDKNKSGFRTLLRQKCASILLCIVAGGGLLNVPCFCENCLWAFHILYFPREFAKAQAISAVNRQSCS